MAALAIPADVEARWRPLSDSEHQVAETLLDDASEIVRDEFSDVDARITAGSLTAASVRRVVATMVKRAMMSPAADGVSAQTQSAGPFSVNQQFANPNGSLYLSAAERRLFEGVNNSRVGWLA